MTVLDDDDLLRPNDFSDLVNAAVSRRTLLTGGVAAAVGAFFLDDGRPQSLGSPRGRTGSGRAPCVDHALRVHPDRPVDGRYRRRAPGVRVPGALPVGRCGTREGPKFSFDATNSADEQAQQAGFGHDGMHFFPLASKGRGRERGPRVVNHEFAENFLLFPDGDSGSSTERVRKSQNAHGVSVVEVERVDERWAVVAGGYSRRITASTRCRCRPLPPALRSWPPRPTPPVPASSARSTNARRAPRRGAPTSRARRTSRVLRHCRARRRHARHDGLRDLDWWRHDTRCDVAAEP